MTIDTGKWLGNVLLVHYVVELLWHILRLAMQKAVVKIMGCPCLIVQR